MSPYDQPPAYGPSPYPTPPTPKPGASFILQLVLGFFGALAYGTLVFFLMVFTTLSYELPQVVPTLVFVGGSGLGIGLTLFLTFYFRWYGFLAGVLLAFLVPVLLVGACTAFVIGVSMLSVAGY